MQNMTRRNFVPGSATLLTQLGLARTAFVLAAASPRLVPGSTCGLIVILPPRGNEIAE
jgi:hypothetical protein